MQRLTAVVLNHVDGAIAGALLVLGLIEALAIAAEAPIWLQVPLTFAWTIPLIWRHRWPIVTLAIVTGLGPVLELVNTQGGVNSYVFSAILAAYTVGRDLDAPGTWWGPALTVGFGWIVYGATGGVLSDFVFVALLYGGAWAVGYAIRRRAVEVSQLTQETDLLRREQAEQERRAVEAERGRIARELHDIVSHNISVITIQAQVVRRRLEASQSENVESLRVIETTSRQAMGEMRRLLGVLRAQDNSIALTPQPGLDELAQLVGEASAAGLDVSLTVEGEPVPVPPGVSLACYRIVQEALTNVRKHTLAESAEVLVRYASGTLEICVDDRGPARSGVMAKDELSGGGHGLVGMRERVMLYDGHMSAGPRPDEGFRVHVMLPLTHTEMAST